RRRQPAGAARGAVPHQPPAHARGAVPAPLRRRAGRRRRGRARRARRRTPLMRTLTGLGRLVRLVLRRDRVRLPVWVLGLAAVVIGSGASLVPLYPEQADIQQYVDLF